MYAMKPEDNRKEYTNGEIVIVWQPELCTHAGICVKMLPQVYLSLIHISEPTRP